MQAILPESLREGAPVGFAATGHIGKLPPFPFTIQPHQVLAHVNLNEEYLPFKNTIGQLFLDVSLFMIPSTSA